ncbi:leukocyte elastase inhibitor-like isoform X2 [Diadema antillarum]|uniref:leukocyte elastase inhibitor-like n=1 Tax=Diadema antillarum TaxID=105358 RepID=UPI003A85932D
MALSKQPPTRHAEQLAVANNTFGMQLFQTLKGEKQNKNLFFSPFSISVALAMTYIGAREDTALQMSSVLQFSKFSDNKVHQAFKELTTHLFTQNPGYTLKTANKLYGKAAYPFTEEFLQIAAEFYDSMVEAVPDFGSPAARKSINDWVSEQTNGKIKDLIAPGVLGPLTRLVLVNAIYFKGNWASQFDGNKTKADVFKVLDDRQKVPVNLMFQSGKFPVIVDDPNDCIVLEMPYKGQDLNMLVILPNKDDGLPKLEEKLSAEVLQGWNKNLRKKLAKVWMPKFKLEDAFSLNQVLVKMGMKDAFDENRANFSGISGKQDLFISEVVHKAFVDVNEKGSEAAAATAVVMKMRCAMPREPEKPIIFRADHPFLFMICHCESQTILFLGRVMDTT